MERVITGQAHVYGDNVDTDRIIPGKYTKTLDLQSLADHVLEDLDPIVSAVGYEQASAFVEVADVAGMQPATAERIVRRLRISPVALHHQVRPGDDLAHLAGSQPSVVVIDDPDLDIGSGDSR